MSDKYTLVHEGLDRWINSPNNGGECCQTWSDTVDELNRLLARIKRLEEGGDAMLNAWLMPEDSMEYCDWIALSADAKAKWYQAKEAKP